jgi:D-alanine-D-alanine ligase
MRIAVLTGGTSDERQVSLNSADQVRDILDFAEAEIFVLPEELEDFLSSHHDFQVVVPVIHGKGGEDGAIQKLLEKINVPYLFSSSKAHEIGIDKKKTKEIAAALGYSTSATIASADLDFPLFAKPRFGGSSTTTGICKNIDDFKALLEQTSEEFILEKVLHGREFTVGVIEKGGKVIALPIIEIVPKKGTFFDFEQKVNPDKLAKEICPAEISPKLADKMSAMAIAMHKEIKAKHMTRSDFIVTKDGIPYFLEINTIPGMTKTSLVPKMLKVAGVDIKELFKEWCENEVKMHNKMHSGQAH